MIWPELPQTGSLFPKRHMSEKLLFESLPLFPLGSVLFPGGLLPLRIFEVRYLDMIGKCHRLGTPFGVVSLIEGSEVRKPAPAPKQASTAAAPSDGFAVEVFNAVGTLALISEFLTPHPGLMVVRCIGQQRFAITRQEKLKHGLWVADVQCLPVDQSVPIPDDLKSVAIALEGVIKALQLREMPEDQMPMFPPYLLEDCAWVANRWCELLPMAPDAKQRLMALDNPLVRLELISDLLARAGILK